MYDQTRKSYYIWGVDESLSVSRHEHEEAVERYKPGKGNLIKKIVSAIFVRVVKIGFLIVVSYDHTYKNIVRW